MSELLPYEDQLQQQWNDLPLPDQQMAWEDMKRRLEEEDDNGAVVWWRRGCAVWGILLALLLVIAWWQLKPLSWFEKSTNKTEDSIAEKSVSVASPDSVTRNAGSKPVIASDTPDESGKRFDDEMSNQHITGKKDSISENGKSSTNLHIDLNAPVNNIKTTSGDISYNSNQAGKKRKAQNTSPKQTVIREKNETVTVANGGNNKTKDQKAEDGSGLNNNKIPAVTKKDSASIVMNSSIDSAGSRKADTLKKSTRLDTALVKSESKKDTAKKKNYFFSGGIALHQQLPIAGQQSTPYSASGRKGSIADYIPSIYIRWNKKDKWFFQGEFRYGAPQNNKQLTYQSVAIPDTGLNPAFTTKTSSTLKKTFYHQLPLTFNYYIRPNWSIGGGVQWNKFFAAVSEKDITRINNGTQQDSTISKNIVSDKNDSASSVFRESYFLGVIETQYQWKRFTIGGRYAFGLQPYIRYQLPGNNLRQEKTQSVQLFIRYELFKGK